MSEESIIYLKKARLIGGYTETDASEAEIIGLGFGMYDKVITNLKNLTSSNERLSEEVENNKSKYSALAKRYNSLVEKYDNQTSEGKELESTIEELEEKIEELENKNSYLYSRIKEKSNQERELPNKKDHSGFEMILSTNHTEYLDKNRYPVKVFKTKVQTYFDSNFPGDYVKEALEQEFKKKKDGLLNLLGMSFANNYLDIGDLMYDLNKQNDYYQYLEITSVKELKQLLNKDKEKLTYNQEEYLKYIIQCPFVKLGPVEIEKKKNDRTYRKEITEIEIKSNILYRYTLTNNFKAGYWELTLFHTGDIKEYPEEVMPKKETTK